MNLTMSLTLEGLVRVLRAAAHRLADDIESEEWREPSRLAPSEWRRLQRINEKEAEHDWRRG